MNTKSILSLILALISLSVFGHQKNLGFSKGWFGFFGVDFFGTAAEARQDVEGPEEARTRSDVLP